MSEYVDKTNLPKEQLDEDQQKILNDDVRAGFKIEIHFGPNRRATGEFKALMLLMESGKFFHGGGDDQMYVCMDHRVFEEHNTTPPSALPLLRKMKFEKTEYGCGAPIPSQMMNSGTARCPGCERFIFTAHLTGQIPFYGTVGELAEMAEIFFRRLKADADIYCKYHPTDIRYKSQAEFRGVETARRMRGLMIYPLYRILQDTASGAALVDRFKACFLA